MLQGIFSPRQEKLGTSGQVNEVYSSVNLL
jgi:hypothetical protein